MRGAFRVEPQASPRQTLKAKKKQRLSKAAVTETVSRTATVQLQARLKGGKNSAGSSAARSLSQALDAKRSTKSVASGVKTRIKLRFSKVARKRIKAALASGGPMKIVVTATATDGYGKTSSAKTKFRLIG
jgi:hypothetical protein